MSLVEQPPGLLIDQLGGLARDLGLLPERVGVVAAERERADLVAHAVFGHHRAGDLRRLLEVVLGPGRDLSEDDLLGHTTSHREGQHVPELRLGRHVPVLERPSHGQTERGRAARYDRHAVHRVEVLAEVSDKGMAHLMRGDADLLTVADHA